MLDLKEVRKVYRGRVEALRGLALQVPRGSVFGLLGPNGAGKSTLVKILTTIIRPTYCEGRMLGQPVGHKPTLRRVGYLPEHARFPNYLTGRQVIEYSAGLLGLSARRVRVRADRLLERVRMRDWAGRTVRTYSKGMKQRVGIAQALIGDPELLFFDEPTDGVDPEGRREIRELIGELREEGRTVFINSHLLSELEQVADQVAILARGEVVRVGALEDLTRNKQSYEIVTDGAIDAELRRRLEGMGAVVKEGLVEIEQGTMAGVQPLIDALRAGGVAIEAVTPRRQSLEELFFEAVGESRDGKGAGL